MFGTPEVVLGENNSKNAIILVFENFDPLKVKRFSKKVSVQWTMKKCKFFGFKQLLGCKQLRNNDFFQNILPINVSIKVYFYVVPKKCTPKK